MTRKEVCWLAIAFLAIGFVALPPAKGAVKQGGVNIAERDGKLVIEIGGQPFAEYYYQNGPKPDL